MINPKYNYTINPRYNYRINPLYNNFLDPKSNYSIDPQRNINYNAPFLYDLKLTSRAFLVRANEDVLLVFDSRGEFANFAVRSSHGFVVFDTNNEWKEHWVAVGNAGWLRFDGSSNWIGLVVSTLPADNKLKHLGGL